MSDVAPPDSVHLVGSIGLDTVDDVYRTVGGLLGPYLRRVPDGEVGGRKLWISWQYPLLRASAYLRPDPSGAIRPTNRFPLLTLAEGVAPGDVRFGELGYAREARASYLDFVAARDNGTLPKNIRFQVCLPTPFAVVSSVVVPAVLPAVEAAYERAMIAEVASLCRHIPHRDLCIQWDVCNEMVIWDGQPSDAVPSNISHEAIIERMHRLCAAVPDDVELGLHLCYGDFGARHFVEPKDAARMVDFANALSQSAGTQARLYPHAGADRAQRRRVPPAAARPQACRRHRAVSRCRPRQGRRRRRQGADRRGAPLRAEIRHRHRMRHGARPLRGHGPRASQDFTPTCARERKLMSRNVYLVGSVPMANAEQVFASVSAALGSRIKRLPDGETGERGDWITWLEPAFANNPALMKSGEFFRVHSSGTGRERYTLKPGVALEGVQFPNLFYADIAAQSYAVFKRLKDAGKIPASAKFQVDLVPAHSVVWLFAGGEAARRDRPGLQRGA